MSDVADRFWSKADTSGGDESCWAWTASTNRSGYGQFMLAGRKQQAHRVAMMLSGKDVSGYHVCHRCDNRKCVNPSHLFLGDQKANMEDASRKGRVPHGSSHYKAKLTAADVEYIRMMRAETCLTMTELAAIVGVRQGTVWYVITGKTWRHSQSPNAADV